MSEMVERVARAAAKANGYDWHDIDQPWHDNSVPSQQDYLSMARAAIEAMREPTDRMAALQGAIEVWGDLTPEDVWQAMLDEALK